jgi:uncharacterized protein YdhG (YjbR/CyaY superfamily)
MTVARYIADAPAKQRKALKQLRAAIRRAAPKITERISYRIPVFELHGKYLLYIAQFKEHVSMYPVTAGMMKKYGKQITRYRHGRGTMRFALDDRIPVALIEKLARVRVRERAESA